MDALKQDVFRKLEAAKGVTQTLAVTETAVKNRALLAMAEKLWQFRADILRANHRDVEGARGEGQNEIRIDRLMLNEERIEQMMLGLRQVSELPDPVGDIPETLTRPNGLVIQKIRVPMGVIAMIYESRPNVTVDAAALAVKTGNAVVLRGGREALASNRALVQALREGIEASGLPVEAIQFIDTPERDTVDVLIQARGLVDLAIPRGGAGLIQRVVSNARVPVIETGVGNCHVYVDREADLNKAARIIVNAKTQRPSVCNAAETLLVHASVAEDWLLSIVEDLTAQGVRIHACPRVLENLERQGFQSDYVLLATNDDWETEYLGLELAVSLVDSLEEAIHHITKYGTKHSEAIVTENQQAAEKFLAYIDAAAVYHNASTRFTDGFEFGFGSEIGISTQKLHARGPMGLEALTSYKYVVRGDGQIRE